MAVYSGGGARAQLPLHRQRAVLASHTRRGGYVKLPFPKTNALEIWAMGQLTWPVILP